MKPIQLRYSTILVLAAFLFTACEKPLEKTPEPTPTPAPTPTPIPTPNPAKGATEQALRLYPDLAKKNTIFNKTFRDLYQQEKTSDPELLTDFDWPLRLANQTASILGVKPVSLSPTPTPKAPEPEVSWIEQKLNENGKRLEKPAYDQRVVVPQRTYFYDNSTYRSYWIDENGIRHFSQ
jgi:hypothetical protein